MPYRKEYNRDAAVKYALTWAMDRNPNYYDFHGIGGDCTNFVSQCLYAGSNVMNYTPVTGWYYSDVNHRAPAWTSVRYLHKFLMNNKTRGVFATEVPLADIEIGDVIQLANQETGYYHSLLVTQTGELPDMENTLICTHTIDSLNRPLNTYQFETYRCLHILGVYI